MMKLTINIPDELHSWFKEYSKSYGGMTAYILQHLNKVKKDEFEEKLRLAKLRDHLQEYPESEKIQK